MNSSIANLLKCPENDKNFLSRHNFSSINTEKLNQLPNYSQNNFLSTQTSLSPHKTFKRSKRMRITMDSLEPELQDDLNFPTKENYLEMGRINMSSCYLERSDQIELSNLSRSFEETYNPFKFRTNTKESLPSPLSHRRMVNLSFISNSSLDESFTVTDKVASLDLQMLESTVLTRRAREQELKRDIKGKYI